MTTSPGVQNRSTVKRIVLLLVFTSLWISLISFSLLNIGISPEQRYADWLKFQRHRTPAVIERFASRLRIHFPSRLRYHAHRRNGLKLLKDPDHALAVGSWANTAFFHPQAVPDLTQAIQSLARDEDPKRLTRALQRCDADGPLRWELTLLRNAELAGLLTETIEDIEIALREYVERRSPGSPVAERFSTMARLYALSESELIHRLIQEGPGSSLATDINAVNVARGRNLQAALRAWWASIQSSGQPIPPDGGLVDIFRLPDAHFIRSELLAWILTSKEAETWRNLPDRDLGSVLEQCHAADSASTWNAVSAAIRQIADQEEGPEDWRKVAEVLLARVSKEASPASVINADAGQAFVWLSHVLDDETLLLRGLECWGATLQNPSDWIGHFVDRSQFAAVAALTELQPEIIFKIDSRANPASRDNPRPLSYFREIDQQIAPHCKTEGLRALVALIIFTEAEVLIRTEPEKSEAKELVMEAIERFTQATHPERGILEASLFTLKRHSPQRIALAVDKFLEWTGHPDVDAAMRSILDGSTAPNNFSSGIWKAYLWDAISLSESKALIQCVETLTREGPDSEYARISLKRLDDGLGIASASNSFQSNIITLLRIIVHRWSEEGDPVDPVPWMFARIGELAGHDPKISEHILSDFYMTADRELRTRSRAVAWRWHLAVLNPEISGEFPWPEYPPGFRASKTPPLDPSIAAKLLETTLADRPLKTLIARLFLEREYRGDEDGDRARNLVKKAATSAWLKTIVDDIALSRPIDPDTFESEIAGQPKAVGAFFIKRFTEYGRNFHETWDPWLRHLDPEKRLRLFLWYANHVLQQCELSKAWDYGDVENLFQNLLSLGETSRKNQEFLSLARRLDQITLTPESTGLQSWQLDQLREWQRRTSWTLDPDISFIDSLLQNETIPLTERVWRLVIEDRYEDAARLMTGREDELSFVLPPDIKPSAFFQKREEERFPASLPQRSEHRIYAEAYLAGIGIKLRTEWNGGIPRAAWPMSKGEFESYELLTGSLASSFVGTKFTSMPLEKAVAIQIALLPDNRQQFRVFMRELESRPYAADKDFQSALALVEFESRLHAGDFADLPARLEEVHSITSHPYYLRSCFGSIPYFLWRRALFNESIEAVHFEYLESFAFGEDSARELMGELSEEVPFEFMDSLRLRMQAVHLALAMIEKGPNESESSDWGNYASIDLSRYTVLRSNPNGLLWETSMVLASRCADWSEPARWNLMTLLQSVPPGVRSTKPLTTFNAFVSCNFVKEGELQRLRDFTITHPQSGLTALTVIQVARRFKDPELERFGWEEAEKFQSSNPHIKQRLQALQPQPR